MNDKQIRMKILKLIKNQTISKEEGAKLLVKMLSEDYEDISNELEERFQAIILNKPGTHQDIQVCSILDQEPGPNKVQILVKAFPINFSDFLLIKGLYPMMPDYPFTPGVEVSGVIRRIGKNVTRVKVGDEVIGVMRLECGGQASLVITDENLVVRKPDKLTHEEACGFPAAFLSMYMAFERAQVKAGDKLFISTATGTNGLVAVQLAQHIGAEIYASAGSQSKLEYLRRLGITNLINYQQDDLEQRLLEMTGGLGVDVVINTTAGEGIQKGLNSLAPEGRYVEIAVFGLQASGRLNLSNMVNNQTLFSFNVKKFLNDHPEMRCYYLDIMTACLEKGIVKPIVAKILPFTKIKEAYEVKYDRSTIGRVVVNFPYAENISTERKQKEVSPVEPLLFPWIQSDDAEKEPTRQQESKYEKAPTTSSSNDIAIIGISGRFADAENVEQYWGNLVNGRSSIVDIPKERWNNTLHFDPDHEKWDKTSNNWGGFMKDIDLFDSLFFNISGHEAEQMDPQQRVFLEESWRALEDAGYATEKISNRRCGVYVGVAKGDYVAKMQEANMPTRAQSFWGNESSILAARISYHLNLKGPAIAIDTACSSSLVAVHMACQSLLTGECELALAGGVFIYTTPGFIKVASSGGMLSPNGQCKTFDNDADGFVPGEAAGALVLKPFEAARRDGDQIYGVIKGSKINQDGKTNGITAPSSIAQTEVQQAVYDEFNIHPETIQYIEAHGTGTKLGDPIEWNALTNTFRRYTDKKQFCGIGSVKTNIGHTAAAAGVSSLIKLLMAFKYRQLPATLNFNTPNEYIDFDTSPFFVNNKLRQWEVEPGQSRRAAASSFGFSGTNAHIVLEESINHNRSIDRRLMPYYLVPISAKTTTALDTKISDLANWLEGEGQDVSLLDICYTLSSRRSHFEERRVWVVKDKQELLDSLREARVIDFPNDFIGSSDQLLKELAEKGLSRTEVRSHLTKLAGLFVQGEVINFDILYHTMNCYVVSLPSYPFERMRYWVNEKGDPVNKMINVSQDSIAPGELHPLLTKNISTFANQRYTSVLYPYDHFLTGHVVNGEKVFPGACFIEMAKAAGELAGAEKIFFIQDIFFLRPLKVDDHPIEVQIELYHQEDRIEFQIYTVEKEQLVIHCEGCLLYAKEDLDEENETINLDDLKEDFSQLIDKEEVYKRFEKLGLHYGPHFQSLERLYLNRDQNEVLSYLEIPEAVLADFERFSIHPILLDGALQTVIGFIDESLLQNYNLFLPIEVGEVEQLHPLTTSVFVHILLIEEEDNQKVFDVYLYDSSGTLLVVLSDFTIQAIGSARGGVVHE
ncbi:beta-ketoacyl synthase N-terminal-like domain-containing protein [Bacillus atrophaeus]|uniref:beta-ketoacyl synthase N-terminal-like domain-containing protein n=1 Tax=Bacillus atrophaeus TaxID=1452 RepID=UPI001C12705A|nr:beta-ketoacyl synthase N-terminal-like domain-containing protein [Bacillus atrophaeus]MBU5262762.1 polyketide synthase dehydratase domain-containing protein [Bacillus atrophaeus]